VRDVLGRLGVARHRRISKDAVMKRMIRPCSTFTSGYGTFVLTCIEFEPAIMFA
jgi:hypothetical protein